MSRRRVDPSMNTSIHSVAPSFATALASHIFVAIVIAALSAPRDIRFAPQSSPVWRLAERSPPMSIGPRQRQDDCEDQSIGRNVQIKVSQAVYQDCGNTSDTTERCGLVETLLSVPVVPDGLGEDPED